MYRACRGTNATRRGRVRPDPGWTYHPVPIAPHLHRRARAAFYFAFQSFYIQFYFCTTDYPLSHRATISVDGAYYSIRNGYIPLQNLKSRQIFCHKVHQAPINKGDDKGEDFKNFATG